MEIVDKRNEKANETEFKPGDVIEYWDDDEDREDHGIAVLYDHHDNDLYYVDLSTNANSRCGETGLFDYMIKGNYDHVRKINAKLILED